MVNSNAKGKAGERELVLYLKSNGHPDAVRVFGQSRQGHEAPDVECPTIPFAIECKRGNGSNPLTAFVKSEADGYKRGDPRPSIVFSRRDNEGWRVTLDAKNLLDILAARASR